jgi:hypothetical protein
MTEGRNPDQPNDEEPIVLHPETLDDLDPERQEAKGVRGGTGGGGGVTGMKGAGNCPDRA